MVEGGPIKRLILVLATLAAIIGGFVLAARAGWLTPSDTALRAKYALPNSKFMMIDGVSVHYIDEGAGEPLVLIHGSFASLREWDAWAAALKGRYRVIRFDQPPMGLSGPGPYDAAHEMATVRGLTAALGLKRFYLVATSSGGEAGAAYAATYPEEVEGLVLSNIAVGPITRRPELSRELKAILAVEPVFKGWHSPVFWRVILRGQFADPKRMPPGLVAEWTDLNNRAQKAPRSAPSRTPHFARTPGDLAKISSPTLLLWSANDVELPVSDAQLGLQRLGAADKSLAVIPDCGHLMPIGCGPQSAAAAGAFFERISAGSHLPAKGR